MFSELDRRPNEAVNQALPQNFKGNASPLGGNDRLRLSPLPARNTLLTIIFFSALAAAIFYWIVFPPAPAQVSENYPPQDAQGAERP